MVKTSDVSFREVGSKPSYHIRSRSVVVIALPCHGRDRGFNSLRDRLLVYKCELHVYVSNVLVVQKLGSNPIFDIISNFVLIF